ncbi:MAG TPA: CheR family methyltransferase, partial [Blastocatellia bacterium]|nr:CheR family methyltransferase [Blastocatellia bacterium]
IAMVMTELMGEEQFKERVKIYATDVDEEALATARAATYAPKQVETIPPELLNKYFDRTDSRYVFRKELRRAIIYGRHDLIQDAPISRVDLLVCRNTLMYFNAEAQTKILVRFHFALSETGYLFLGKSEMLLTHTNLFTPIDLKRRVFQKVAKVNLRDRLIILAHTGQDDAANQLANYMRLRETSFDTGPLAQIVVDANGFLVLANQQARVLFGITQRDIGRLLQDLEISYRPVELRSMIEQAYVERRLVSQKEVMWKLSSRDGRYLDVDVTPLVSNQGILMGVSITFTDVTRYKKLEEELQRSKHELETAYEELQSTVEELETTNEELQSTNEELETLNEELQSTNEELETMNEEQQSTTEEVEAMNEELRQRTNELDQVNNFLASILSSVRMGIIVINPEMHVEIWNRQSENFWGLRQEEVIGKHLLNLEFGLDLNQLKPSLKAILSGKSDYDERILQTINRRGKQFDCRVTLMRHDSKGKDVRGVIIMMEDMSGQRNNNDLRDNG